MWTALAAVGLAGPGLIVRELRPELLDQPAGARWRRRWRSARPCSSGRSAAARGRGAGRLACSPPAPAAALLAGAAVWDLVAPDWSPPAGSAVALALALAARRLGDLASARSRGPALVGVARALWMVPELSLALLAGLLGVPVPAADLPGAMAGLSRSRSPPCCSPRSASRCRRCRCARAPGAAGPGRPVRRRRAYLWFKQAFGLAERRGFRARGLAERTIVTQALFLAGWLLGSGIFRPPRLAADGARLAGTLLTAVAAARLIWFDMMLFNPAWRTSGSARSPVLNLILPDYLLGAVWLYRARRRAATAAPLGPGSPPSSLALIAATALLVRQCYQAPS